jgi:large subunit ribosomal protein L24
MAKEIKVPKVKLHVKKGDLVRVLTGNKDELRGKEGRILKIVTKKNRLTGAIQYRAIVEGLNMVSKHEKRGTKGNNDTGSIKEKEASIHISNLQLIDPKTNQPTRIGRKKTENGWLRYSKKSGEIIK